VNVNIDTDNAREHTLDILYQMQARQLSITVTHFHPKRLFTWLLQYAIVPSEHLEIANKVFTACDGKPIINVTNEVLTFFDWLLIHSEMDFEIEVQGIDDTQNPIVFT